MIELFSQTRHNDFSYALQVLTEKNRQVARNVANADTPKYKATKLDFYEAMNAYTGKSNPAKLYVTAEKHIQPGADMQNPLAFVRHQNNMSTRTDGNDVNLDYEMSEQASASIMYSALTELAGSRFATLKEIMRTR